MPPGASWPTSLQKFHASQAPHAGVADRGDDIRMARSCGLGVAGEKRDEEEGGDVLLLG